jgi:hypothetical protein
MAKRVSIRRAGYDSPDLQHSLTDGDPDCGCTLCTARRMLPTQHDVLTAELIRHDAALHEQDRRRAAEREMQETLARERAQRIHRWVWRANWTALALTGLTVLGVAISCPQARVPAALGLIGIVVVASVLPWWQAQEWRREGCDARPVGEDRGSAVPVSAGAHDLGGAVDAPRGGSR